MAVELYPVIAQGFTFYEDFTIDTLKQFGKVCAVIFLNQGANSRCIIEYGGIRVVLAPGASNQGATYEVNQPTFGYDANTYKVYFENAGGVATQVNRLIVSVQRYVEQKN